MGLFIVLLSELRNRERASESLRAREKSGRARRRERERENVPKLVSEDMNVCKAEPGGMQPSDRAAGTNGPNVSATVLAAGHKSSFLGGGGGELGPRSHWRLAQNAKSTNEQIKYSQTKLAKADRQASSRERRVASSNNWLEFRAADERARRRLW